MEAPAIYRREWQDTLYTRAFVIELVLEKHNISISEWLDSVIKSAKKAKFKMLPQFTDYDSLKLDENDLKILADKLGGGCLEFAERCVRAMKK